MDFPRSSVSKESACNSGDWGPISGLERSLEEGNCNELQYPCLGNPMDRGAWWAIGHGVPKSWGQLSNYHFHFFSGFGAQRFWQPILLHREDSLRQEKLEKWDDRCWETLVEFTFRLVFHPISVTPVGRSCTAVYSPYFLSQYEMDFYGFHLTGLNKVQSVFKISWQIRKYAT